MKYYLRDDIDLVGWQKLPYALRTHAENGMPYYDFINGDVFSVVQLCDGTIDLSLPFFSDKQRQIAKELVNFGIAKELQPEEKFSRTIPYTYYDNRYINSLLWSLTGRCNSKCKHCYMSAPNAKYGEVDHDTILKMVDDIASAGIGIVDLTGGECLVRPDFLEIVDRICEKKIYIRKIYSNGYLVNEKLLEELNRRNVRCGFSFSFDGVGHHDWMRGIDGAEKMTDRAIELCVRDGRLVDVEMCLFRSNKNTLRETINHLAKLGVSAIKTSPVSYSELWEKNGGGETLDCSELYEAYLEYIPHYFEDGKPMSIMLGGFFLMNKESDTYLIPSYKSYTDLSSACVCGHARNTMYICADGRVSTCMGVCDMAITKEFPFVQEAGMKECLTSSAYMQFIDTRAKTIVEHNPRCRECEYRLNCAGGCRAGALVSHPGDRFAIDESTCAIFKGGYIEKIKTAVKAASPGSKWDAETYGSSTYEK